MVGAGAGQWPNTAVVVPSEAGAGGTLNTGFIENPDGGLQTIWQLRRDPMTRVVRLQPRAASNCLAYWRAVTDRRVHFLGRTSRRGLCRA